jgi:hypothetical protein
VISKVWYMMTETRRFVVVIGILCAVVCIASGCHKQKDPARMILTIEGEEFSRAQVFVDGKQAGTFTQTLIKPNGEVHIDGVLVATKPPNGSEETQEEDMYSGSCDSLTLEPGTHAFAYQTIDGKRLEFEAPVSAGRHLVIYFPDKESIKWDDEVFKIAPGSKVTLNLKKKGN